MARQDPYSTAGPDHDEHDPLREGSDRESDTADDAGIGSDDDEFDESDDDDLESDEDEDI